MLQLHPEHCGQVKFLALLVPSKLEVEECGSYLDDLMAAAGQVNARHGDSDREPIRVPVGENYLRAVADMQLCDALWAGQSRCGDRWLEIPGQDAGQMDRRLSVVRSNRHRRSVDRPVTDFRHHQVGAMDRAAADPKQRPAPATDIPPCGQLPILAIE